MSNYQLGEGSDFQATGELDLEDEMQKQRLLNQQNQETRTEATATATAEKSRENCHKTR